MAFELAAGRFFVIGERKEKFITGSDARRAEFLKSTSR